MQALYLKGDEKIENLEVEKGPEEKEAIYFVLDHALQVSKRYREDQVNELSLERIHVLVPGGVEIYGGVDHGVCNPQEHSMAVDRRDSLVDFAISVFHETMHLYQNLAAQKTDDGKLFYYRAGSTVADRTGHLYFSDLNEAVVGYLTKAFFQRHMRSSAMFKQDLEVKDEEGKEVDTTRVESVKRFESYIEDLYARCKEEIASRDEIREMFIKAAFTGKILPVARLVERVYGKGSNNVNLAFR